MITITHIHKHFVADEDTSSKLDKIIETQGRIRREIADVGKRILDALGDPKKIAQLAEELDRNTQVLDRAIKESGFKPQL